METVKRSHDPNVCGIDPATDCDNCRPHTLRYRQRELRLGDVQFLQGKLEKAGINVGTFVDMIWLHIAESVERRIDESVRDIIGKILEDATIISTIRGVHHNRPEKPKKAKVAEEERWD